MLNFNYLEKGVRLVSLPRFVDDFSRNFFCYTLLTDQISLPDYLYISRYWAISILQLFVKKTVIS